MQQSIILFRRKNSNIWDLREVFDVDGAREHGKRLESEGHEVLILSPEAQTAFFALVPEARALVRTSVIGNKAVFDDWHGSIHRAIGFLSLAAVIEAANIAEITVNAMHPIFRHTVPLAMVGPICVFLALNLFAIHRLAALNKKVASLVSESVSRTPMLNNLFPNIARYSAENRRLPK